MNLKQKSNRKTVIVTVILLIGVFTETALAQKIRTVKPSENYHPTKQAALDTFGISLRAERLDFKDVQKFSIFYKENLPSDYYILLKSQLENFSWNKNTDLLILYNFNYKYPNRYLFAPQDWRILFPQNWAVNPFLDQFGELSYHIFRLSILNLRDSKIVLALDKIVGINYQSLQQKCLLRKDLYLEAELNDDGSSHSVSQQNGTTAMNGLSDNRRILLSKKIIRDNLFTNQTIYPNKKAAGIICFPIQKPSEKIVEIIIPDIKLYTIEHVDKIIDINLSF